MFSDEMSGKNLKSLVKEFISLFLEDMMKGG